MAKKKEQLSVYLANGALKVFKSLMGHFRWNASQTLTELALYYERTQEWAHAVQFYQTGPEPEDWICFVRNLDTGELEEADLEDLAPGFHQLQLGILGAFRDPVPELSRPWMREDELAKQAVAKVAKNKGEAV